MLLFLLIKFTTIFNNGEIWASALCKVVKPSSTQHFPTPANRGVHAGTSYTITLRSYRRRTRKIPQDPTPATNVLTSQLNCTSNYSHHGMATTNYTVTQYINDYFYSHTVNKKRLYIQPHSK